MFTKPVFERFDFVLGFFPEYDSPECLVMLQFNIPDSLIPYNINFKIPNISKSIFELDNDGSLIEKKLNTKEVLSLEIKQNQYYCQFYVKINKTGSSRKFHYNLNSDRNIEKYYILIQQPLGVKSFNSFLKDAEVFNDEYNLKYHRKEFLGYYANDIFQIDFQYEKESNLTSIQILDQILTDKTHGDNNSTGFKHENELSVNEQFHNKFQQSKYLSFIFGIPLILIIILIYKNNNNED
ncbi:MAG: hypothetical protein CMF96_04510 [Candidatus Marinimicrobia bacterium]|nr:hypothetical protein [Candidatus Neomarinimicrobiota bacterium]